MKTRHQMAAPGTARRQPSPGLAAKYAGVAIIYAGLGGQLLNEAATKAPKVIGIDMMSGRLSLKARSLRHVRQRRKLIGIADIFNR